MWKYKPKQKLKNNSKYGKPEVSKKKKIQLFLIYLQKRREKKYYRSRKHEVPNKQDKDNTKYVKYKIQKISNAANTKYRK